MNAKIVEDVLRHNFRDEQGHRLDMCAPFQEMCEAFRLSIPMILTCPYCNERHIDAGEWATKPHHTHACQSCGMVWRPAVVNTVGVQFLPGFKD